MYLNQWHNQLTACLRVVVFNIIKSFLLLSALLCLSHTLSNIKIENTVFLFFIACVHLIYFGPSFTFLKILTFLNLSVSFNIVEFWILLCWHFYSLIVLLLRMIHCYDFRLSLCFLGFCARLYLTLFSRYFLSIYCKQTQLLSFLLMTSVCSNLYQNNFAQPLRLHMHS